MGELERGLERDWAILVWLAMVAGLESTSSVGEVFLKSHCSYGKYFPGELACNSLR